MSSQADPPILKTLISLPWELDFQKIKVCDLKMLLMVFWGSLGLVLGALGGFLGALLVPLRALDGTLNFKTSSWGSLTPPSCPPRSLPQPPAAPQAPSWRGKWPHEATKAHLETYLDLFSTDLGPEIKEKKKARGIVTDLSKRLSALELFIRRPLWGKRRCEVAPSTFARRSQG